MTFREELKALIRRRWMEDSRLSRLLIECILGSEDAPATPPTPAQPCATCNGTRIMRKFSGAVECPDCVAIPAQAKAESQAASPAIPPREGMPGDRELQRKIEAVERRLAETKDGVAESTKALTTKDGG